MFTQSYYDLAKLMQDFGWFSGYYSYKFEVETANQEKEQELAEKLREIDMMVDQALELYTQAGHITREQEGELLKKYSDTSQKVKHTFVNIVNEVE